MPSPPPETKFYEPQDAATLWRDGVRLYENFLGSNSEQWEENKQRFQTFISDLQTHLRDSCHEACRRDS